MVLINLDGGIAIAVSGQVLGQRIYTYDLTNSNVQRHSWALRR